jgi:tetratricopeptide (TPR) repeat protein
MRKTCIYTVALLALSQFWISASARAQAASQPSADQSALPAAPNPAPPSKDKSKTGMTPAGKTSAAPDAPQAQAKKPSTAEDNPFPEAVSEKAAAAASDASTPNALAPTTTPPSATPPSAPKQSQGSSSLDGLDKLGLDDPTRTQLKLESPDGTTDVYDPKRATEDVKVGKFYMKAGDYKGAYDRFKDATLFDHENAEAIFWLAEAARKLNLEKEAAQNYQLYLEAVPDGPNVKIARKALGELASNRKP